MCLFCNFFMCLLLIANWLVGWNPSWREFHSLGPIISPVLLYTSRCLCRTILVDAMIHDSKVDTTCVVMKTSGSLVLHVNLSHFIHNCSYYYSKESSLWIITGILGTPETMFLVTREILVKIEIFAKLPFFLWTQNYSGWKKLNSSLCKQLSHFACLGLLLTHLTQLMICFEDDWLGPLATRHEFLWLQRWLQILKLCFLADVMYECDCHLWLHSNAAWRIIN